EKMKNILTSNTEEWRFTNARGVEIDGLIYYPPDFDPSQKYPCIVYYYGGTSPVNRGFGGRYPKNLWAARGYVVYVLQPSGATGYGQAFSALHVNDWGRIVADEIIDGVKQFLTAHPFVDDKKVGCIGASFGGFMTQLLITRTDLFAAAVSHAGISAIASYWGEGYWGYSYNSVSAANSFPWNRKDIYVDQSPLFAADKIVTPLLLTHGGDDTNVPPGESEQMYIALKLLGKEVEYLKVAGQNHWVMDYKKRKLWTQSIMAWFDKWLKEQPGFWNDLYDESIAE
ncbi:S9 family peptidase, partial [candidate division KSB1 bacterium]|nr:S9 family peptidase [candidate division KSB1 bacterium]